MPPRVRRAAPTDLCGVPPIDPRKLVDNSTSAALDVLLRDPELLAPIAAGWREEAVSQGRPSIVMEAYSA